jgi:hypothetical protein
LYLLRCEGRIPHRAKMNLLVRLLLEIKADFLPRVLTASLSASLRHSGIEAKIDGVASGSRAIDRVRTLRPVKSVQHFSPIYALRGRTKY